jgi:hypothetical protein
MECEGAETRRSFRSWQLIPILRDEAGPFDNKSRQHANCSPPSMKSALLESIRSQLKANLERLAKAAMDAHAAATDPDSKAESIKRGRRGTHPGGQAEQLQTHRRYHPPLL